MEKLTEFKGGLLQIIAEEMIVERVESLFEITSKQANLNSIQKENTAIEKTEYWTQHCR